MNEALPQFLSVVKHIVHYYVELKTYVNKALIPLTNRFDTFELLFIWTVIVIVLYNFYLSIQKMAREGFKKSLSMIGIRYARKIPFVQRQIQKELDKARLSLSHDVAKHRSELTLQIPEKPLKEQDIRNKLSKWYKKDLENYSNRRITGSIYVTDMNDTSSKFISDIAKDYLYQNPLHFDLFPSVAQIEAELISMVKNLYHGDEDVCGLLTSGGTESIMMSMLAYREWGRERGIEDPEIVAPITAHVAFEKATFYYKMRVRWVPVDRKTGVVKASDMKKYINKNTVCLVTSCPNYPYGSIDPIEEVGLLARKYGIGMHVDCCLGGFIVPFADDTGLRTKFDFRCKDVTTISVDPHKYGLAPKGVSICLFKNSTLRNRAIFSSSEWIGGIYATPTHAGSRGGAPSVGAWVSILSIGYEGFKEKARKIIQITKDAVVELRKNKHIKVVGDPQLGTFSFLSDELNCFDINDILSKRGWHASCLQYPPGVHMSVTNFNLPQVMQFVKDVNEAVDELIKNPPSKKGSVAQLYGTAATLPESIVREGAKLIMDVILKA